MAKDFSWFKFKVNAWITGDIHLQSYHLKGVFADLCAYYWSKECSLTVALCEKKVGRGNFAKLVAEGIVKKDDERAVIEFLDEGWQEMLGKSEKNAKSANERWGKNTDKNESERNANALQTQSVRYANKIREDKIREDESKSRESITHSSLNEDFFKMLPNSPQLETICMQQSIQKDYALSMIEVFKRKGADPSYQNFPAFTKHFSGWIRKQRLAAIEATQPKVSKSPSNYNPNA